MFCPSCGKENSIEQKFCRSCGLNLEPSAVSLAEQRPNNARTDIQVEERRLEAFGKIAFGGFGVVVGFGVLGILYAILSRMILSGLQPLFGVILMAFVIFAALSLAYVIWNESIKEKRQKLQNTPAPEALPSSTAKLLEESTMEPVPSVVENTTKLLTPNDLK